MIATPSWLMIPTWLVALAVALLLLLLFNWKGIFRGVARLLMVGIAFSLLLFLCVFGLSMVAPNNPINRLMQTLSIQPATIEVLSIQAHEQDRFEWLIITIRVTNTGAQPACIDSFSLHDWQNRTYVISGEHAPNMVYSLNPGLDFTTTLSYPVKSAKGIWWLSVYPECGVKKQKVTIPVIF